MVGWVLDLPVLKSVFPGLVAMKANTAIGFILGGVSLWLLGSEKAGKRTRHIGQLAALSVASMGLVTLGEYLFGWDAGIDQLLFREAAGSVGTSHPGRMAVLTALNFVLLGLALLSLDFKTRRGYRPADFFTIPVTLTGFTCLTGYAYGAKPLYGIGFFTTIAVHTAATFVVLCVGLLCARPERGIIALLTGDTVGGAVARRLLPATFGIVFLLGWLRLEGQRAGLYDTALGTSLYAVLMVVIFGALTLATARMLNRMDALRRRAEETLRESEERFRSVTETAHDAIVMADQKGAIVLWNKGAQTIFGYSANEVLGQPLTLLMPERYHDGHRKGLQRFLQTGEARVIGKTVELHGKRKDGGEFPLELSLTSWKTGNEIFFSGIIRDISERKGAEEVLRESEERYRLLFDENPLPVWVFDLETLSFLAVNEAAVRHYGFSREEFLKMTIKDIRPAEDIPALLEQVSKLKNGAHPPGEWRHRKKDGTIINVEIVSHLLNFGGKPAELVLANDITERKRAEEERDKFFTLSLDMLCIAGFDGHFKRLNPIWEKTLGYTVEELCAKPFMEFVHPEDREKTVAESKKLAGGGDTIAFENRYHCKDGSYRWFMWSATASVESGLIYAAARDITERKRVEREIEKLNEALRQHAAQLEAANKELEAFSYSVSHDLRAPLRSIDGFSQAVMEDCREKLDEQGKDYLGRVRAACQRMAQLIDDMLNLSRVSRGEMRMETVDLSGMAREIVSELQRQAPERKVTFVIADKLLSKGDPRLLRIAMENLLGNAWKYTSKRATARVEFGADQQPDGKTAFFIRDDGAGFDMAYAGKLFGAFQRLHGPAEFAGTGVGLATVQRIVHRHGGRVWAEGAVEQGATFYFTL